MARAYKCDCCGQLYESEYSQTIALDKGKNFQIKFHYLFGEPAELCEECYEATLYQYEKLVIKNIKGEQ